jgi:hypothetical protein
MKMDGGIRVRTDKKYGSLYRDLTGLVINGFHELFYTCACVGYRSKQAISLGKRGEERFWSNTFTPEEWAVFYAIVLEENNLNFSAIDNEKQIIARIEEYANGGMAILLSDFLDSYVKTIDDEIVLDVTASKELAKDLLQYVNEKVSP